MADALHSNGSADAPAPPQGRRRYLYHILEELGLVSLYQSRFDVKLLCMQRFVRLFAYGASALVLVAFMEALGFSKTRIGFFMTLTLVGDVCISLVLTLFADSIGRKAILMLGAALMSASGLTFALSGNYWVLLIAAVVGVISPAGNEIGPFRAVEESMAAHLTTPETRTDIFAWYTLSGSAGTAFGLMASGWTVRSLTDDRHWELVDAYRALFVGYAVMGAIKFVLALSLSSHVESDKKRASKQAAASRDQETAPLLGESSSAAEGDSAEVAAANVQPRRKGLFDSLPDISPETRLVMLNLCILFGLDSFSSGLATLSWITYFFRWKHNVDDGVLGSIFFVTSLMTAASVLVASSLAKRFGNVKTMVFTHLPSDIFLALIPIPDSMIVALIFLFIRDSTKSMDTAPRTAFMAAILLPEERTAVMGFINVLRTVAQSVGPTITGVLVDRGLFWVVFVTAGVLKMVYDIGLLALFKNHERDRATRAEARE
ncbi:MFS general substrate transporter [Thozetella sp. PMI_491]|nr:MFS general substrate transporter [Thozetella sp. PMI_491]